MTDFPRILADALRQETMHLQTPALSTLTPDTNVLEIVDSFTVVNLLLQSEMMLESETGSYVTLADETIFDAQKSPLLKWSRWVKYVEGRHGK